jgi:hypothetical protein
MDPLGLSMENFDAVGRWRTVSEAGTPLDVTGQLLDGTKFEGIDGLRAVLVRQPDLFVSTVIEKLLTYALGRRLEYSDGPAVRRITREAARDGYRWSAIVAGIARSVPFQKRRVS